MGSAITPRYRGRKIDRPRVEPKRGGPATALENAVMDLWDAGRSKQAIARELKITLATVNRVFGYMADNGESRVARSSIIAGSAMLARAILQARAA
ncbi:hypothetical protein [Novosphingobium sp.]|uniref:hypothetical protein n=1 Tax=Novosphingobium sp. TaxID=1874826 RepID=UPI00286DB98F|nr:hypothetical protein [Novosphingobium sp.]